ncbi:MAG: hypothetical protein JSR70_07645 [Proteobacteria bacterium]|nr:hypothetical protein [Pseudomonadota bacterium]
MDWLEECNRIDHRLHDLGIPDDIRMRAMAEIMTIMAQAEKRRIARDREEQALELAERGMAAVTERQGCHRATVYRRMARAVARLRNSATKSG